MLQSLNVINFWPRNSKKPDQAWLESLRPGLGQALVAKVAKKAWLWPYLPGFTRPHFPGKPGQKAGKPGLAGFLAGLLMQG